MSTQTFELFRQAVLEHSQVVFSYKGFECEACPHVIGYGPDDKELCLVFQFSGDCENSTSLDGAWRCIDLSFVRNAKLRIGPWRTAPSHTRPEAGVTRTAFQMRQFQSCPNG